MNGEANGNPGQERDSPFLPSAVRSLFPGVEDKVYFHVAVRGLIPQAVAEVPVSEETPIEDAVLFSNCVPLARAY